MHDLRDSNHFATKRIAVSVFANHFWFLAKTRTVLIYDFQNERGSGLPTIAKDLRTDRQ